MTHDLPFVVIGGRGPHGLALHLSMQRLGFDEYGLIDDARHWLSAYGPDGPMQAVTHLRSPRELDFALGDDTRAMVRWRDADGSTPLAGVYGLEDAARTDFNEATDETVRAPREAFWRYANDVARASRADERVIEARVERLEIAASGRSEDGWTVHLSNGRVLRTRAVLLATGLAPHLRVPAPWLPWWNTLPEANRAHALTLRFEDAQRPRYARRRVAVLGSANTATWETAARLAECGADVTLLSRAPNPIEWQLPFPPHWFRSLHIDRFRRLPQAKRLRTLKTTHVPASALPGSARRAEALGVRVLHFARVQYAAPLWNGVQLQYRTPRGDVAEHFDLVVAATGHGVRIRDLPFLVDAARSRKAPVIVGGPARNRPLLDETGRWKNLPPLYPLGAHALASIGLAAPTLASATAYLPLVLPDLLDATGVTRSPRAA